MGLARLGLDVGIFGEFLYIVLLLSVILGLDFLGLALSRSQVRRRLAREPRRRQRERQGGVETAGGEVLFMRPCIFH